MMKNWVDAYLVCVFVAYSMSDTLPTGQLSNVPWRRTGVKYTNNEAYFDVVEEIDVIIDKSGSTVFAEIQGYVSSSDFIKPLPHIDRDKFLICACLSVC